MIMLVIKVNILCISFQMILIVLFCFLLNGIESMLLFAESWPFLKEFNEYKRYLVSPLCYTPKQPLLYMVLSVSLKDDLGLTFVFAVFYAMILNVF